jgi:hypothetical protein
LTNARSSEHSTEATSTLTPLELTVGLDEKLLDAVFGNRVRAKRFVEARLEKPNGSHFLMRSDKRTAPSTPLDGMYERLKRHDQTSQEDRPRKQ